MWPRQVVLDLPQEVGEDLEALWSHGLYVLCAPLVCPHGCCGLHLCNGLTELLVLDGLGPVLWVLLSVLALFVYQGLQCLKYLLLLSLVPVPSLFPHCCPGLCCFLWLHAERG